MCEARVSNRKGQNKFVSEVSSRPTLGKIETTPQIGYALGKVRGKAILYQAQVQKNGYVTKIMRIEPGAGVQAVRYTTSTGYFESLTSVVWCTPQTTSKVVYLSASDPASMLMVLVT